MKHYLIGTLIALISAGGTVSAATLDELFVESNGYRDGAGSDIGSTALGDVTNRRIGVAGRIAGATDVYTFESSSPFTISFGDFGVAGFPNQSSPSQTVSGLDLLSSDTGGRTDFKLSGSNSFTTSFSTTQPAGTPIFGPTPAGSYTLTIDGSPSGSDAFTYDVQVSAVPLPAGLPLLAGALGLFGVLRSRRAA